MVLVEVVDVPGGGLDDFAVFGEQEGLKDIHRLRDVGHGDFVGVLVEDVQRDGGHERIAEGVLLPEEGGVAAGGGGMPAPHSSMLRLIAAGGRIRP